MSKTGLVITLMLTVPTSAAQAEPRNVILMITDGVGFNGWSAANYYEGRAGEQPYQVERPDGTQPRFYGMAHWALNPVNADGEILEEPSVDEIEGVHEQGYDPATRWHAFENAFRNVSAAKSTHLPHRH